MRSTASVVLAATACVLLSPPAPAHAEVSAECWAHLVAIPSSQRTTAAGDVRYHRERGELSPCTEREAAEADRTAQATGPSDSREYDDGKSRYCRKRWFC